MGLVVFGVTAMAWTYSARNEYRTRFPEEGRFFPSRWFVIDQLFGRYPRMLTSNA